MATLLELTGKRAPVEATPGPQQIRRKYQNDFESISGAGRYVRGQRGYNMMAEGLGASVGSPAQEKAMALLAGRLSAQREAQRGNSQDAAGTVSAAPVTNAPGVLEGTMLNAPAMPTADPEAMERQAGIERLQLRRQGYTGGIADRFVANFGRRG
jgi:hypothetical protein